MNSDYNTPAFKKLLQRLQEESWQLELIISGFAIFGLFSAYGPLDLARNEASNSEQWQYFGALMLAQISCAILIFTLLLHVLLRALWIGALGLRYVSGDIDYEELRYSEKFTRYLKKKVGSFDKYIAQLENYCSIIFAVSFLLIFYVLAITLTIMVLPLIITLLIQNEDLPSWLSKGVGITLIIFWIIGLFLTFIDFISQGFLKRKKWLGRIYFPFYWVFSFATLSFLYRPIIYNFLDNRFGRRLSFLLVPLGILLLFITSLKFNQSNYFSVNDKSNDFSAKNSNYEDLLDKDSGFISNVAIQSKVITDPYVKVFFMYSQQLEDRIYERNKGLRPDDDKRGISSQINFENITVDGKERDSLRREYLKTLNELYSVKIDSTVAKSDFVVTKSKKGELGFEMYLPTDSLKVGKHTLELYRNIFDASDTSHYSIAKIPFWFFNK